MVNTIRTTVTFLMALGTKAIAALAQHNGTLFLPHTEAADVPGKMTALKNSHAVHKESLLQMKNERAALEAAIRAGRRFMTLLRETLKEHLGKDFSQAWTAVGFARGFRVPSAAAALLDSLTLAEAYLGAHPIGDAGPGLSAARATLLRSNLAAAMTAVTAQREAVDAAITERNEDITALEQALRTLLRELHEVLDPLDSEWLAFGFNKPGAKSIPAIPENAIATLIGATSVSLKWDRAARASYYRVWKKVVGVDEDFVPVGSSADLHFTLEGLPANAQVEIVVTAVNNGGESQWSTVLTVQTENSVQSSVVSVQKNAGRLEIAGWKPSPMEQVICSAGVSPAGSGTVPVPVPNANLNTGRDAQLTRSRDGRDTGIADCS